MHQLVPQFILQKLAEGEKNGRFSATALFADISGFTTITETLMQHGQHGAEVLATVMRAVFAPLVHAVFAHGGYVVGFAGDAFTAIFPGNEDAVYWQAFAAGWRMQQHMRTRAQQSTDYGDFAFSAKVGIAAGVAEWGILQGSAGKRATYYFRGTAVQGAANAEHHANKGDLLVDAAVHAILQNRISAEPVAEYFRVVGFNTLLPVLNPITHVDNKVDLASQFFPRYLITQSISGEFRQVINLFINLEGEPSPNELTAFMETIFALQEQYGGLLNRIDFGDKGCHLLFFWGAPVSHENDIHRVLNFMLDLQAQTSLTMRAGITYRIAHAGFVGSSLHEEYTCYGRGVNLAARFMTTAPWQNIWVDAEIYERARGFFRFEYVDDYPFKGFANKQPVFLLQGHRQSFSEPFFQGGMFGRDAELAQLNQFVRPVENGRFAGIAVISGEAGIGKSRLVHEFLENAELLETAEILLCQTDEISRRSLNPFRYWLRDYFDQSSEQDESENKQRFERVLDSVIEDVPDQSLAAELERTRSFLGALQGLYWPESLYEQVEPQLRFENTLTAMKALLKAESRRQPILLHIEDAHWFDDDSWQFLQRLTRNIDNFPIAVLMTSREPLPDGVLDTAVPHTSLPLKPLESDDLKHLIINHLGESPTSSFLEWLTQRTDGNPYFAEQMLLYLQENNLLETQAAQAMLNTSSLLPTDVRTVLVSRLDRLSRPVREVVQTASVLGREFDKGVLLHMKENPTRVEPHLNTATVEEIWVTLSRIRYLFKQALMRDAAYDMQVHTRLHEMHQQAAVAYESFYATDLAPHYGTVAYHFDMAKTAVKALPYYERAANHARENYQNEEALAQYGRALSLVDSKDLETRYRLLLGKEAVLNWLGRRDEQAETLRQLSALLYDLPEPSKQADVALRLAALGLSIGQSALAIEAAQQSAQFAAQANDAVAEAKAYHRWGRAHWQEGHYRKARPYLEKALVLAHEHNSQTEEAQCYYDLSVIDYFQANYQAAQESLQLALLAYEAVNDKQGEVNCLVLNGIIYSSLGNYTAATTTYQNALTICRNAGWRYGETRTLALMGNNYFELGNFESSYQFHTQAVKVYQEIGDKEGEAGSLDTLGLILHNLGQFEEAVSFYEQAMLIQHEIQNARGRGYTLTHFGMTLLALGDFEKAQTMLQQALSIRQEMGADALVMDTRAGLAFCAMASGEFETAVFQVRDMLTWIDAHGTDGIELPVQVYLMCYRVLETAVSQHTATLTDAQAVLEAGYALLQERANRIQDNTLRQQFLETVPYNHEIFTLWQSQQPK
ncbi:MAG: hypothetical protein DWQ04_07885 [Chloroflexi bacterium]|nr:MAG: hypothetical protein DWQ04_07885 [Chloroflexota bacterium]